MPAVAYVELLCQEINPMRAYSAVHSHHEELPLHLRHSPIYCPLALRQHVRCNWHNNAVHLGLVPMCGLLSDGVTTGTLSHTEPV